MSKETAETTIAIGTVVLAGATVFLMIATAFLVWLARMQLPLLNSQLQALRTQLDAAREAEAASQRRHEQTRSDDRRRQLEIETMRICSLYDTDPVLHAACRRMWDGSDGGANYDRTKVALHDVISVSNYLDGVCVGVLQGLYSSEIARDHLGPILQKMHNIILPKMFGSVDQDFDTIRQIYQKWYPSAGVTYQQPPSGPKS
jgi:hypothetical protein